MLILTEFDKDKRDKIIEAKGVVDIDTTSLSKHAMLISTERNIWWLLPLAKSRMEA